MAIEESMDGANSKNNCDAVIARNNSIMYKRVYKCEFPDSKAEKFETMPSQHNNNEIFQWDLTEDPLNSFQNEFLDRNHLQT